MSDSSDSEGQAPHVERKIPNILVTGTPGTGKTTTSELIAEATGLTHVNVGDLVKQKQLHEGYLEEFDTHILDEDKVMQHRIHQPTCYAFANFCSYFPSCCISSLMNWKRSWKVEAKLLISTLAAYSPSDGLI